MTNDVTLEIQERRPENPINSFDLNGKQIRNPEIPAVCEFANVAKLKAIDKIMKTSAGMPKRSLSLNIVSRP